jgi:hypothetical protein
MPSMFDCGDNLKITSKRRSEFKFKVANIGSGKVIGLEHLDHQEGIGGSSTTAICDSHFSEVYAISIQSLREIVHQD